MKIKFYFQNIHIKQLETLLVPKLGMPVSCAEEEVALIEWYLIKKNQDDHQTH